jgi:hypothetical protein
MLSVPEVVASGDTFATDGLLLEITTFTPPWSEAPRVPVLFSCRPDPTVVALVVIPGGALTVPVTLSGEIPVEELAVTVVVHGREALPP